MVSGRLLGIFNLISSANLNCIWFGGAFFRVVLINLLTQYYFGTFWRISGTRQWCCRFFPGTHRHSVDSPRPARGACDPGIVWCLHWDRKSNCRRKKWLSGVAGSEGVHLWVHMGNSCPQAPLSTAAGIGCPRHRGGWLDESVRSGEARKNGIIIGPSGKHKVRLKKNLTEQPYFRAIPCNVSVFSTSCRTRTSVFLTWLHVLPYFLRDLADSRIDCFSVKNESSSICVTISVNCFYTNLPLKHLQVNHPNW